jgi:hypothetical protein
MGDISTAVLVAVVGLAGVVVGAALNQHGAWLTAGRNIRAQRHQARDAALRDWRKQRIAPILANVDERARALDAMINARGLREPEWKEEAESMMSAALTAFNAHALQAEPDKRLRLAIHRYLAAEQACISQLAHSQCPSSSAPDNAEPYTTTEAEAEVVRALREVHREAERYMFGL